MNNPGALPSPPLAPVGSSQNTYGGANTLDSLVNEITSTNNMGALSQHLRNFATKDIRETILASSLSSGQDPLSILDPEVNTLGYLYIL